MKNWDIEITKRVHEAGASTYRFWYALSVYGMWLYIAYFLFIWMLYSFSRYIALEFIVAVAGTFFLTWMLRNIVRRPRPKLFETSYVPWMNRYTFPSIHASTSFAFATALVLLSPPTFATGTMIMVASCAYGLALLITISRIMVGVHYASDLLAGLLLGIAVSAMVIAV